MKRDRNLSNEMLDFSSGDFEMGLFSFGSPSPTPAPVAHNGFPINQIDLTKRYDIYYTLTGEERLYENVRFLGIRSLDPVRDTAFYIHGYLEIESIDGSRMFIPPHGIQMICEHGTQPSYRVVRQWDRDW